MTEATTLAPRALIEVELTMLSRKAGRMPALTRLSRLNPDHTEVHADINKLLHDWQRAAK